jgi:hypothetical protein
MDNLLKAHTWLGDTVRLWQCSRRNCACSAVSFPTIWHDLWTSSCGVRAMAGSSGKNLTRDCSDRGDICMQNRDLYAKRDLYALSRAARGDNADTKPSKVAGRRVLRQGAQLRLPYENTTGRARVCAGSSNQPRLQGSSCQTPAVPTSAPAPAATARAGNQGHSRSWQTAPTRA